MPFLVHISDADRAYLQGLPLSTEAKRRADQFIDGVIANVSDEFRLDPENRAAPNAPYFVARFILLDIWGDGRIHALEFHVRDDKANFGVLLIVFIDHH